MPGLRRASAQLTKTQTCGVFVVLPLLAGAVFLTPGSYVNTRLADERVTLLDRYIPVGERPYFLAHRGSKQLVPENTLPAFAAGFAMGAAVGEADVQLSSDGQAFLMHDPSVSRTCHGSGSVGSHSAETLRSLDCGSKWSDDGVRFPYAGRSEYSPPELSRVLQVLPSSRFELEVKDIRHPSAAAKEIARVVDAAGARSRVSVSVVAAVPPSVIRQLRTDLPDVVFAGGSLQILWLRLLVYLNLGMFHQPRTDIALLPANLGPVNYLTSDVINTVHAAGQVVEVHTLNDAATMRRALDLGVDGIITDRPDIARDVFCQHNPSLISNTTVCSTEYWNKHVINGHLAPLAGKLPSTDAKMPFVTRTTRLYACESRVCLAISAVLDAVPWGVVIAAYVLAKGFVFQPMLARRRKQRKIKSA